MARSDLVPLRRAIVAALKADAGVVALVPAARIYQPETPDKVEWPFIRYGVFTRTPLVASCLDGSIVTGAIHAFARGPGDDKAAAIVAALVAAFGGADGKGLTLDLGDGATAHVVVTGDRVLPDPAEASSWHGVVDLEVTVAA